MKRHLDLNDYITTTINQARLNTVDSQSVNSVIYDIIVPVFNGFDELKQCVNSLLKFTAQQHNIYLYNDASTDQRVKPWLDQISKAHKHIHIYHQSKNRGYLKNSNEALNATNKDVVLLNSDTQVTKGWLQELSKIATDPKIAMACPLSDNATLLTITTLAQKNLSKLKLFTGMWYPIPTAVGSCMLIKKSILDQLIGFDDYYDPGYGEECDLSMKVRQLGFDIACAPASFVYHSGGASFTDKSNRLKQQHQKLLDLRWPNYSKEVQHFLENNPINIIDESLGNQKNDKHILHVVHGIENEGGVELFTRELLEQNSSGVKNTVLIPCTKNIPGQNFEVKWLNSSTRVIYYQYYNHKASSKILNKNADLYQQDLDKMFIRLLISIDFNLVHFHSFVGLGSLIWPLLSRQFNIPYIVSCHDHFSICFNYSLLTNKHKNFCNKTICSANDSSCVQCLKQVTSYNTLKTEEYISLRNQIWNDILEHSEAIIAPDQYLADILKSKLSNQPTNKINIVEPYLYPEHKLDLIETQSDTITVGFLGTFSHEKGAQIFLDAYSQLEKLNLNWKIIGKINPIYNKQLSQTHICCSGKYQRTELKDLLSTIDVIILPSIAPESYSITLTEAWLNNKMVIASDIGAFKSRIHHGDTGYLFKHGDANSLANAIESITTDKQKLLNLNNDLSFELKKKKTSIQLIQDIYNSFLLKPNKNTLQISQSCIRNTIKPPKDNAYSRMERWLNSDSTLEAASDWSEPPAVTLYIIGNEKNLLEDTYKSCQQYAPGSIIKSLDTLDSIDKSSHLICIINQGHQLNDNFGNWVNSFKKSEKTMSLADYALIDKDNQIYGPQFQADFDVLSHLNRANRVGAVLCRCKELFDKQGAIDLNQSSLSDMISQMINGNRCHEIHYFPHLSYLYKDSLWAKLWKQECQSDGIEFPNPTNNDISIILLTQLQANQIESYLDHLISQKGVQIKHIYVFNPLYINNKSNKLVSFHNIDFNQPEIFINPVVARSSVNKLLFLNDNMLLNNLDIIKKLNQFLNWQQISAISPAITFNYNPQQMVGEKMGHGQISSRGILKDIRFDSDKLPKPCQLLDPDCFIITKKAWDRVGGFAQLANVYYRTHLLSQRLFENNFKLALLPLSGVRKKGLPSYFLNSTNADLESQRLELFNSNKEFYLNSFYYSKSFSVNDDCQLDEYSGAFKTPKTLPRVLAYANDTWASGFYRVRSPITSLAAHNKISAHFLPKKTQTTLNYFEINKQNADAVLLHNFLDQKQLIALQSYKKHLDIPLILSLDDLITEIPEYNPFSKSNPEDLENNLIKTLSIVDRVIVSTQYLANKFSKYHDDIKVINNYLSKELWSNINTESKKSKKIRIGWAGAPQHEDDLAWLQTIIKATQKDLQWVFFGFIPNNIDVSLVEFHPHTSLANYHLKLASLGLDIAIAPLIDNAFNHAKSHLKLLEYGVLGIATICSDITPYQNSPALQLKNDPELWIQAIQNLAQNMTQRQELAKAMKHWVYENYFLEDHLDQWQSALLDF